MGATEKETSKLMNIDGIVFARFVANAPTSQEENQRVQTRLNFSLPDSYVALMLAANGGEGFVGESALTLWKIEELIAKNDGYHVNEFAPGIFLFGSDGGGEAFGFDTRSEARKIVSIPFVAMEIDDARILAPDFEAFILLLLSS